MLREVPRYFDNRAEALSYFRENQFSFVKRVSNNRVIVRNGDEVFELEWPLPKSLTYTSQNPIEMTDDYEITSIKGGILYVGENESVCHEAFGYFRRKQTVFWSPSEYGAENDFRVEAYQAEYHRLEFGHPFKPRYLICDMREFLQQEEKNHRLLVKTHGESSDSTRALAIYYDTENWTSYVYDIQLSTGWECLQWDWMLQNRRIWSYDDFFASLRKNEKEEILIELMQYDARTS